MNGPKMKIKEMALLNANAKEVKNLISQELPNDKKELLKYYLLPKEWLDNYKDQNGYKIVAGHINYYMMKDYQSFKALLEDDKTFDLNFKNCKIKEIPGQITQPEQNISLVISNSLYQNILCPKNFVPIKEEIINNYMSNNFDFSNKNLFIYDVLFRDGNIFVFDNRNKKNVFVFIYDKRKEFFSPIYLLSFINENGISEMINYISERDGINSYLNEKKLYMNAPNEQLIYDNRNEQIGSFINLSNLNSRNNNINKESIFKFASSIPPKISTIVKPQENNSQINISNNLNIENEKEDSKRNENNEEDEQKAKENIEGDKVWEKIMEDETYITQVKKKNYDIKNISNPNNTNNNLNSIIALKGPLDVVNEENFEDYSEKSQISKYNNNRGNNYPSNYNKTNYIHNFDGGLYDICITHNDSLENNMIISNLDEGDDINQNNDGYNQNINNANNNNLGSNIPFVNNNINNVNTNWNNLNYYKNQNNDNINYQNSRNNQNNQNIYYGNICNNFNQNSNMNYNYERNMNVNINYQNNFNNQDMCNAFYNNNSNINKINMNNFHLMNKNNKNNLQKSYFDDEQPNNSNFFNNQNINNNYINQNIRNDNILIKENFYNNDEIILTLISRQLNKKSQRRVKINEKLIKILELFKDDNWITQHPISYLEMNNQIIDHNKSLYSQGISRNIELNVVFQIK